MARVTNPMLVCRRERARCSGTAMIEFALTVLLIFLLIFSLFEFSMLLYTYNVMADAAKEGVRYAIVHGASSSPQSGPSSGTSSDCTTNITNVQDVVKSFAGASLHNTTAITVNVCYLDGSNQTRNRVQVKVSYPYIPYIHTTWNGSLTVHSAAEGRIVY